MTPDRVVTIKLRHIHLAAVVVVALALLAGVTTAVTLATRRPTAIDTQAYALRACEDAVRNSIITPATAVFSGVAPRADGPTVWRFAGDIDAQNALGAMIRKHWTCVAQGAGTQWTGGSVELT